MTVTMVEILLHYKANNVFHIHIPAPTTANDFHQVYSVNQKLEVTI